MPMVFGWTLTLQIFVFFTFQSYVLPSRGSVRAVVRVKVRLRACLLRFVRFYRAYCTLVVRYCYVTGGI